MPARPGACLRKSFAEQQAKAILAGVSVISGPGNQGDLYYEKQSNAARIVLKPDRNTDMQDSWIGRVAEVLGISQSRISVSPNAPKDFGSGSTWIRVRPDGSVETDPGLEQPADPVDPDSPDSEKTTFFYDQADERKFASRFNEEQREALRREHAKTETVPLDRLHATQAAVVPEIVDKYTKSPSKQRALVIRQGDTYYIADGHHRLEADKLRGETKSDVDVVRFDDLGEEPMTERKAARLEMSFDERILKADEHPDYTLVVGVVMVPERFDNQGDIASASVIEDAAHWFMEEQGKPAVMHKAALKKREATVVESYVVRGSGYSIGGTEVPEGAWVIAWRVYDPQTRAAIKKGIFGGFSLGADADYVNIAG